MVVIFQMEQRVLSYGDEGMGETHFTPRVHPFAHHFAADWELGGRQLMRVVVDPANC